MTWLALTFSLQFAPPAPAPPAPWRLVDGSDLHVGLRPAALISGEELAVGATLQITSAAVP